MNGAGPTFICIGAAKAGTTWLWENLNAHPDFWVPPIKELHWFDHRYPPPEVIGVSEFKHRQGLRRYAPIARHPSLRTLTWLHKFYTSLDGDGAYSKLFDRQFARHMGDITPAYAILTKDAVTRVLDSVSPDCRILFVMREPADRLWSGIRMYCRHNRISLGSLTETEIEQISRMPEHQLRTDYSRTLEHWAIFGDRLGLFFYEDMASDPKLFLRHVLSFLGADPDWQSPLLMRASNVGESGSTPPSTLMRRWREQYKGTVADVKSRTGRVPIQWEK